MSNVISITKLTTANLDESAEQRLVIRYAKKRPYRGKQLADWLFHIPNGGKRSKREAARMKSEGVKPGVSDLMLALPAHGMPGLFIEMKKTNGKPSDLSLHQKAWLALMSDSGYATCVAFGAKQAIDFIENYVSGTWNEN